MSVEKVNIFGDDEETGQVIDYSDKNEERRERPQRNPEPGLEIIPDKKKEKPFNPGMPKERPVIKKKKEEELPN